MMPMVDRRILQPAPAHPANWRGRSGRLYALRAERIESFVLRGEQLYLMARGSLVLWAGSADDLVNDSQSRARFRLALDCADRVFRVEAGDDHVERMTVIWDLEGAEPAAAAVAA